MTKKYLKNYLIKLELNYYTTILRELSLWNLISQ